MRCPICGSNAAKIEFKAGKGKFNVKAAVVGGLLTGGIGVVAGFKDRFSSKGYIMCSACGYDQFASVDPNLILETEKMEQIEKSTYYTIDFPLRVVADKLIQAAKENSVVANIRYDEVDRTPGGQTLASFPCIVIENPNHPTDYLKFCIQKNIDGNRSLFTPYIFGNSPQLQMKDYNDNTSVHSAGGLAVAALGILGSRKSAGIIGYGIGSEVGKYIGTSIRKSINSAKMDAGAIQWEQMWYADVSSMIGDVFE